MGTTCELNNNLVLHSCIVWHYIIIQYKNNKEIVEILNISIMNDSMENVASCANSIGWFWDDREMLCRQLESRESAHTNSKRLCIGASLGIPR